MSAGESEIRRIEELSANAWAAFNVVAYDGWLVRSAEGYTRRANSVLPLYASSIDLSSKVLYCNGYYRSRGLPSIFKMTEASLPRNLDTHLASDGCGVEDESSLYTVRIGRRVPISSPTTIVERSISDEWIDGFLMCSRLGGAPKREIIRRFAHHLPGAVLTARAVVDDRIVGCGLGLMEKDWVGLFDIVVDADSRRKGIATEIVNSLLDRSAESGAQRAYLQVVTTNHAAIALYERLGFRELYRYWYRVNNGTNR